MYNHISSKQGKKFLNLCSLISDTQIVFRDEVDGLSILDVSGKLNRSTLVPNRTFTDLNAMYYGVSANQKYVWLAHDYYKVIIRS